MPTKVSSKDVPVEIKESIASAMHGAMWEIVYALYIKELDCGQGKCYYIHCNTDSGCFGALCRLLPDGCIAIPPDEPYIDRIVNLLALCAHRDIVPVVTDEGGSIVVRAPGLFEINDLDVLSEGECNVN